MEDIESMLENSEEQPQLIYKHSHRCSICFLARQELDKITNQASEIADLYLVNVIHQRDVSNAIASTLDVRHESPQAIVVNNRSVAWKGSHWDVKGNKILELLNGLV